eukprot:CAMPEP_0119114946 /NCGR_PEP_ID=MMETSP1180-20130426/49244_1 /TAXON_ID=3052 ORGANISM="Chlamydomonas cf sp, Strain CCMP681" /NCGR_SAMPLE_ID=MMETSP1180 /ASSEMBLY_ACC=CAM_ASM_000741 /LENGTH=88 /DNA_ID=CAMNT_0007103697 /DNA_START=127 /DNA_END=393 /DNA_ORIENTATION=+
MPMLPAYVPTARPEPSGVKAMLETMPGSRALYFPGPLTEQDIFRLSRPGRATSNAKIHLLYPAYSFVPSGENAKLNAAVTSSTSLNPR